MGVFLVTKNIFRHEKTNVLHRYYMDNTDYFLLNDVAKLLNVQAYQIVYLITTRKIPEPRLRIGGKRIFTIADIYRIAEKMQVELAQELIAKGEI